MKRFALLGFAVLAAVGVLAAVASAKPPTHETFNFAFTGTFPAGIVCNFTYTQSFTATSDVTTFSDGRQEIHQTFNITHTNVDTHVVLTEQDQINSKVNADGSGKQTGVFWHLRDANGKIVVVHAGEVTFDTSGNVVKFTPNSGPDFVAVICPALGGNPA